MNKDRYTKIFLTAADLVSDDEIVKAKRTEWWYNNRDQGGLRLTEAGLDFVIDKAKIKTYNIKFPGTFSITPQILVWLDRFIDCPFYLTKKDITVLSEKSAFELYLFSGDVKKMGYSKALAKRLNQESVEEQT